MQTFNLFRSRFFTYPKSGIYISPLFYFSFRLVLGIVYSSSILQDLVDELNQSKSQPQDR